LNVFCGRQATLRPGLRSWSRAKTRKQKWIRPTRAEEEAKEDCLLLQPKAAPEMFCRKKDINGRCYCNCRPELEVPLKEGGFEHAKFLLKGGRCVADRVSRNMHSTKKEQNCVEKKRTWILNPLRACDGGDTLMNRWWWWQMNWGKKTRKEEKAANCARWIRVVNRDDDAENESV
jgi:hypothetical protein